MPHACRTLDRRWELMRRENGPVRDSRAPGRTRSRWMGRPKRWWMASGKPWPRNWESRRRDVLQTIVLVRSLGIRGRAGADTSGMRDLLLTFGTGRKSIRDRIRFDAKTDRSRTVLLDSAIFLSAHPH